LPKIIILLRKTTNKQIIRENADVEKQESSISHDKRGRSHTPHSSGLAQPASPARPASLTSPASPLGRSKAAAPWQCTKMHFEKKISGDEKNKQQL